MRSNAVVVVGVLGAVTMALASCSVEEDSSQPASDSTETSTHVIQTLTPPSSTTESSSSLSEEDGKLQAHPQLLDDLWRQAGGSDVPGILNGAPACGLTPDEAPADQLAARMLAVGVTDWDSAEAAVRAGVRHLFIGTGSDLNILNGQGDPERSLAALERIAGERLTISVDEEGGLVQRLQGIVGTLPSAREMASTMSTEQVRGMMYDHGRKLRAIGLTVDFAPVVDLGGGEDISDNAIGSRAFSADPEIASMYGWAYAQGLLDAGITPVLKHFPGHGHATGDSHLGGVTSPPLEELEKRDLVPFARLSTMPGIAVMVGHMEVPGLTEGPSSVDPAAYRLLREGGYSKGYGTAADRAAAPFNGMVFTDDLSGMKAVTDRFSPTDAVVAALVAGADQALTAAGSFNVEEAVQAIGQAIHEGRIDSARVYVAADRGCQMRR